MVNDPFSDLPFFFFVVKNSYDLRSQIRFSILSKERTLTWEPIYEQAVLTKVRISTRSSGADVVGS